MESSPPICSATFPAIWAVRWLAAGTAPDIAGRGVANPGVLMLSAAMMLRDLGQGVVVTRIERVLAVTLVADNRTRDLVGDASTAEFGATVLESLPPP